MTTLWWQVGVAVVEPLLRQTMQGKVVVALEGLGPEQD